MAWRDTRSSRRRMLVFSLSVVFGVAALVAIGSFEKSLEEAVDEQARALVGADLVIASREKFTEEEEELLRSIPGNQSREVDFSSMVYFPETGGTRLAQIRALGGDFPYYGRMETDPPTAATEFRKSAAGALVEDTLLAQYGARVGSQVSIGELKLPVLGSLQKVPGETVVMATISPRVYIPLSDLPKTRLLGRGSMARYKVYFHLPPKTDVPALVAQIRPQLDQFQLSYDTVGKRRRTLGRSVENASRYLDLVGFVALLLGGVGIANAVHVQIRQKLETIAVLRCLGASVSQTVAIYLLQGIGIGLVGSLIGAVVGVGLEKVVPVVLADFLPLQAPALISWQAIGISLGIGLLISVLFTLLPLVSLRKISPLLAIRQSYEPTGRRWRDPWLGLIYVVMLVVLVLFSLHYTEKRVQGWAFAGGLLLTSGILLALARGIMFVARRLVRLPLSFPWRQGIANLHRPNNRTALLMLSLGLGTFLILTVYLVQHSLLDQLVTEGYGREGDTVLFDIQADQRKDVIELVRSQGLPLVDEAPIVTMRLSSIKGESVETLLSDRRRGIPRWALRREYRSTYTDRLRSGEKLLTGRWHTSFTNTAESIPVSLEEGIARELKVDLGDELSFDVQGVPVKARVASLREVDWRRVQPNFFVVFPPGSLEGAPSFSALVTRSVTAEKSAGLQRAVVQKFPNISVIDLRLILQTLESLLDKVSLVVPFMALFTAFTGVWVLAGAVVSGRYQHRR
jgi:putative ABC transport system permease protein